MKKDKRGQTNIYKILLFSLIGIILILGIVFGALYLIDKNKTPDSSFDKKCSELKGAICGSSQTCSGKLKTASDTSKCCIGGSCSINSSMLNSSQALCGNGKCDLEETAANCARDCYPENLPYSVLAIHEETFGGMQNMVELANRYNTSLSIFFWPGVVDYILSNQTALNMVHEWQAEGHEIGIHNQGCDDSGTNDISLFGSDDAVKYEQLAAPYKIKSGTSGCQKWLPNDYKYNVGITRVEGRSSRAILLNYTTGKQIYSIAGKPNYFGDAAGCGGVQIKIDQYMTLNPNEIYGFITHTLEVEGCEGIPLVLGDPAECAKAVASYGDGGADVVPFETWLKFLYEKDPSGKRRLTLSKLMENYVLPNNLVIDPASICSSTNSQVQECLPVGLSAKAAVLNQCIFGSDTDIFNFGRCVDTSTFCQYNSNWVDNSNRYCPLGCTIKNVSEFDPSQNIPSNYCGDGVCADSEVPGTCPSDCSSTKSPKSPSGTCGDGICDGASGEKTSCPADCTIPVK